MSSNNNQLHVTDGAVFYNLVYMQSNCLPLVFVLFSCCALTMCKSKPSTLFKKIAAYHSGIRFNNIVRENDSINPIDMEFLYNGGGIGVGDFNNDGLRDLYFTASTTSNKLYLNKGNLQFSDATDEAGVSGEGLWANAVSVIDINNDGLQDIYISNSIKKHGADRRNLLYINQGIDKNKMPHFKEMAAEYGLADTSFSVNAAFFDYDNDGDLDMYLLTTRLAQRQATMFGENNIDTSRIDADKLFRNDWNEQLHHPVFTDVSKQAGITETGYGLGLSITDINHDGWKDIYVTNDFLTSDHLYINNKDGSFTNMVRSYFKHTSQNAMGNDVGDINNDGLQDIITVDMNPQDNLRKKKNLGPGNYFAYQQMVHGEMMLQYVRNTLQLNMGYDTGENDSISHPVFSDISFTAGVAETDWSWCPLLADADNDGYRDLLITNGYPKDVTDRDFAAFRSRSEGAISKKELLKYIPEIKIANYAYHNNGNLTFSDSTAAWGLNEPSFSAGAVYADLDNDGDVDYVVSNINQEAFVYENTTKGNHYLTVDLQGSQKNRAGIGAWIQIYYNGHTQTHENNPYRGYLSTTDTRAYFGLGHSTKIDSVVVRWPDWKKQVLVNVKADQVLTVNINAAVPDQWTIPAKQQSLFEEITSQTGIACIHHERDAIDFNKERLLPHKLSQYGPALAVADVNGDGLDDIFLGGNTNFNNRFFIQQANGKFIQRDMSSPAAESTLPWEATGCLLFDADADGDNDLYLAGGGNEAPANSEAYADMLFLNDGKGNFLYDENALPKNFSSKSCIRAADIDNDGDLDLFIGSRVVPGSYPQALSSHIYRNDSKKGLARFTDVTAENAPGLQNIGLVCDALWTDFDNDGQTDLLIAGEWMAPQFFKNTGGSFKNITANTGLSQNTGWWNALAAGDFDNDGDIDYVAGNLGTNSYFRASPAHPAKLYTSDFDKNGSLDAIPVLYLPGEHGKLEEFTAHSRDEITEQLPMLKKRALLYKDFGAMNIQALFKPAELKIATVLNAANFSSCLLRNLGNGKFESIPLPVEAQLSAVFGMIVDDIDADGNLDIVVNGNDFGAEVTNGRNDAFNGLLLLGGGDGHFKAQSILQSGIYIPGDGKALVKLKAANGNYLVAAAQNNGPVKIFRANTRLELIPLQPTDKTVWYELRNGKKRKAEIYLGSSFLSQSVNIGLINQSVQSMQVANSKGQLRTIQKNLAYSSPRRNTRL